MTLASVDRAAATAHKVKALVCVEAITVAMFASAREIAAVVVNARVCKVVVEAILAS